MTTHKQVRARLPKLPPTELTLLQILAQCKKLIPPLTKELHKGQAGARGGSRGKGAAELRCAQDVWGSWEVPRSELPFGAGGRVRADAMLQATQVLRTLAA